LPLHFKEIRFSFSGDYNDLVLVALLKGITFLPLIYWKRREEKILTRVGFLPCYTGQPFTAGVPHFLMFSIFKLIARQK